MGNKTPGSLKDDNYEEFEDNEVVSPHPLSSTDNFIIQFIHVENVPKADMFSESDPFIESYLTVDDKIITDTYRTSFYMDNKSPVYNSYRNFYCNPPSNAVLVIKVYDYDNSFMCELLGWVHVRVSELTDETVHKSVFLGQYGGKTNEGFTIKLRRVYINRVTPLEKTVFFIRHGESKWNKAQDEKNIGKMFSNYDHALTGRGCHQARLLNAAWKKCLQPDHPATLDDLLFLGSSIATIESVETDEDLEAADEIGENHVTAAADSVEDVQEQAVVVEPNESSSIKIEAFNEEAKLQEYIQTFLSAKKVYSSPLTRAIETALIGLSGHEALINGGVTLYSLIREIKGPGGIDSVGTCYGEEAIRGRLQSELLSVVDRPDKVEAIMKTKIHENDAQLPWWTPPSTFDSKGDVDKRIEEVLNFIRYEDFETAIFVGHSLFFKRLCSKHVSAELERNRPELANNMKKHKLSNASMLAVTLRFSDNKAVRPRIKDAELMFGGRFHINSEMHGTANTEDNNT